jgi:hypothetical protein
MKSTASSLLAAALVALVDAQATTVINDPSDTAITTIFYSVCPTATTITTTLPSTITYCPGEGCNGGGPTITAAPTGALYTSELIHVTFTGADGKVTELEESITVFPAQCPNGPGMCQATYTITEECPCSSRPAGVLPSGFTTTVHVCSACGENGASATITETIPCETGPYASVTPEINPMPSAAAAAYASAYAAASANAQAGGNGAAAAAGANSGAGAAAGGSGPGSANAAAGAGAGAAAAAGSNGTYAGAGAGAGAAANAGAGADSQTGAGMGNVTSPYPGAADRTAFTVSTILVAIVASFAWML